ncbi:MAG: hypothetical protein FJ255_01230 [Phycisphaerae bacterium]|nr:hypothetical protein [Phycisphaerae bacterium]
MSPPTPAERPTTPSLGKRLWRRYRVPGLLLVLLVVGWFVLTQSPLTGAIVLPRLSERLGARVRAERVRVWLDGTVRFDRLRATTPGVAGPAASFAEAERVEAVVNWGELFGGRQPVRTLTLTRPLLRISQSMGDGSLNVPPAGVPGVAGGPAVLPRVTVSGGVLELGEHTPSGYRWLKRIAIDGDLSPAPTPEGGGYAVRLEERQASGEPGAAAAPFALEGRINDAGLTLILKGVDMKDWPPSAVPTPIRPRWEQLDLAGRLSDVRFTHSFTAGSPIVRATLDGVAINLPLPAEGAPATGEAVTVTSDAFLRVHGTSGTLRLTAERIDADLRGIIEDLPYAIRMEWRGVEVDAPFECVLTSSGFELGKDPRVLRYAPQTVRERLRQFSDPTGIVDTRIAFRRGPPVDGVPAEIKLEGELTFRDAVSSFADFPYEFRGMTGRVTFDADSIAFHDIVGTAGSGATVRANAHIAPLTGDAGVDVEVEVRGVPLLDPALRAALGPERAFLIDEIISQEAFEALASEGVLRPPGAAGAAPVFAPGGTLDLSIFVRRIFGERADWSEAIVATIREPRFLPRRFPIPLAAREASLHIQDTQVDIDAGVFQTPTGGVVELAGRLDLGAIAQGREFAPELSLVAGGVPADGVLRAAIAAALERAERGEGVDPAAVVRALDTGGLVSGRVDIAIDPQGKPSASGRIRTSNLRLRPAPGHRPSSIELDGLSGTIAFRPRSVSANVDGRLQRAGDPDGVLAIARFTASIEDGAKGTAVVAGVDLAGLDASAPLEDFAALLSESVADDVRRLRAEHRPAGRVDAQIAIRVAEGGSTEGEVSLSGLRGLEFDAAGARVWLGSTEGRVTISTPGPSGGVAAFDGLSGPLRVDGEPAGTVRLSGTAPVGASGGEHRLRLALEDGRFESALTRRAALSLGGVASRFYDRFRPAGAHDLELEAVWTGAGPARTPQLGGRVRPHALTLTREGQPVRFERVSGEVEFDADGGRLVGLALDASRWRLSLGGDWQVWALPGGADEQAASRVSARLVVGVESTRDWGGAMPPGLRAALPDALRELLDDLAVDVGAGMSARDVGVTISDGPDGLGVTAAGLVRATGVSLDAGVPIADAEGALEFRFERRAGAGPAFECWATLDTLAAGGVRMTRGRVKAVGGEDGDVLVPVLEADCHGGRVAGSAAVSRASEGERTYAVEIRAADVRLGDLLDDLRPASAAENRSDSGRLEAHLSLEGAVGDPTARWGRGSAQVGDGRVVSMPLALSLVRVSNLQPPMDERLDLASARFHVDGRRLAFEELLLASRSVEIVGYGTMDWDTLELDLRFNSRSGRRVPVISDIVEAVRDELITTEVTGTAMEPEVRLSTLPVTRWVVRRVLGVAPSAQERRLERIRREATQLGDRLRRRRGGESRGPDAPALGR